MWLHKKTVEAGDTLIAWSNPPFKGPITLGGVTLKKRLAAPSSYFNEFAYELSIPKDMPAGDHQFVDGQTVTVTRTPPQPVVRGSLRDATAGAILELTPGVHVIDSTVKIPDNLTIHAHAAVVINRSPRTNGGAYDQLFFWPQPRNLTLVGGEWHIPNRMWNGPDVRGIRAFGCRFIGTGPTPVMGEVGGEEFVDCEFHRVGLQMSTGLALRCKFTGVINNGGTHNFMSHGAKGLALISCHFDGTDRGPVFSDSAQPNTGILIQDLRLTNIDQIDNGNELLLFESIAGRPVTDVIVSKVRGYNNAGDINLWNAEVRGMILDDLSLDDSSVLFTGMAPQTGCIVQNSEFRGGGVVFRRQATNNSVINTAFIGFRKTRSNQTRPEPALYDPNAPRPHYYDRFAGSPIHADEPHNFPVTNGIVRQ
jgi:hypothetical protein